MRNECRARRYAALALLGVGMLLGVTACRSDLAAPGAARTMPSVSTPQRASNGRADERVLTMADYEAWNRATIECRAWSIGNELSGRCRPPHPHSYYKWADWTE